MSHLKNEAQSKAAAQLDLRKCERDSEAQKQRGAALAKRNDVREQFLLEIKEGSKILEDQLKLMDKRYLDLRGKLDWTRSRETKARKQASKLRVSLAVANDRQMNSYDDSDYDARASALRPNSSAPRLLPVGTLNREVSFS
mmetsp:Transcript_20501/g.70805  ORF Transcript_20501/g.70805 Transcript_20501/m.70805 type:complete len:141 (+) Transcript_20501:330-752(+)